MGQPHQAECTVAEEVDFLSQTGLRSFHEGTNLRAFETLGAHPGVKDGQNGTFFAVWAPNAQMVSVIGDFNGWDREANPLMPCPGSGVWWTFVPAASAGASYRYHIVSDRQGYRAEHADPFGFRQGGLERTSSVWDLAYAWHDQEWTKTRSGRNSRLMPVSIYEMHLSSWMRVPEEGNRPLTYREVAPKLADYVSRLGFTHVEFLGLIGHAADASGESGFCGYYAPDARYGTPQDLMYLIDTLHQRGVAVILDWSAAWFPQVEGGLAYFDGTHLFELTGWTIEVEGGSSGLAFDFAKAEVRSFLLSSAVFWVEQYHVDGLRLGSVGSILYLDFGRRPGEWMPNAHGGRENPDGLNFLRHLNTELGRYFPGVMTACEETTAWPMASGSPSSGGLGFTFKWDLSCVEDLLHYLAQDPFFRKFDHERLVRRSEYAFHESFLVPFSYKLAAGKQPSLLSQMNGDTWQKFANLRLLLGFLFLQPGKKLLFMGSEFAQWAPWNPDSSLDWHLCAEAPHHQMQRWVGDLNAVYRTEWALHSSDNSPEHFEWVEAGDAEQSVACWLRRDTERGEVVLAACNFTPVVRQNYRVGVRRQGQWREILNSDATIYGGSGQGNFGRAETSPFPWRQLPYMMNITLPPLATVVFKHEGGDL